MQPKILLVEDEVAIARSVTTILKLHGMEASWAADGSTALEMITNSQFVLILCDINLPDVDGYEILRQVRSNARTQKTRFIFLTAFAGEDEVTNGISHGADDYITKPFPMHALLAAVRAALQRSSDGDHLNG